MELITVNYATAQSCIEQSIRTRNCAFLRGSPGIGKSDLVKTIAKKFNLKLIDVRLSQREAVDLLGYPSIDKEQGKASYVPMDDFPIDTDQIPEGYNGWLLFLDEINHADPSTQKAAYRVILDKEVGSKRLHKNVAIVLAGNLDTDNALTDEMGTAIQSRLSPHLILEVDFPQWMEWAETHGIDHRICSFLQFRRDLLHSFDPDHADVTYPCPRSWEFANRYINGKDFNQSPLAETLQPLLAGTLGSGCALEFQSFLRLYSELPTLADLESNPDKAILPDKPDVILAMTGFLAHNANTQNIKSLMRYIARLDAEFQAVTLSSIERRQSTLSVHPEITNWYAVNADRLIA